MYSVCMRFSVLEIFFAFLVQFLGHEFVSIFASNGYNSRVVMSFHKFG